MVLVCPGCGKTWNGEDGMFCPECGTSGELLDESKLGHKNILDKKVFDYLKQEFDDVLAIGYQNVKGIDVYDERNPSKKNIRSRWIKESSAIVLKDKQPFLSVEIEANTTPINVAGNVLVHAIADSLVVKYKGRNENVEYPIDAPRYLLIIMPDLELGVESNKDEQMKIIELLIKELKFTDNSSLKNFKICLMKDFEKSINQLIVN